MSNKIAERRLAAVEDLRKVKETLCLAGIQLNLFPSEKVIREKMTPLTSRLLSRPPVLDNKAIDTNQPMNALMRLNQIQPGLQYKLLSQSGPVHAPVFTMSVDVDGTVYEASGSSKKLAKLRVAVKVLMGEQEPTGQMVRFQCLELPCGRLDVQHHGLQNGALQTGGF